MLRPFALDGGKLGVGEDCLNCDLSDLCDLRDELTWRVGDVGWWGLSELQFI